MANQHFLIRAKEAIQRHPIRTITAAIFIALGAAALICFSAGVGTPAALVLAKIGLSKVLSSSPAVAAAENIGFAAIASATTGGALSLRSRIKQFFSRNDQKNAARLTTTRAKRQAAEPASPSVSPAASPAVAVAVAPARPAVVSASAPAALAVPAETQPKPLDELAKEARNNADKLKEEADSMAFNAAGARERQEAQEITETAKKAEQRATKLEIKAAAAAKPETIEPDSPKNLLTANARQLIFAMDAGDSSSAAYDWEIDEENQTAASPKAFSTYFS